MFFLLRTAFWLSVVVLFLPAAPPPDGQVLRAVGTDEALLAAQAAVKDAAGFCARNPQACETGTAALLAFGQKAQTGARWVYEFIGTQIATYERRDRAEPSPQHTLMPSDLQPGWRGPESRRSS